MTALVNTNGGLRVVGKSLGTGPECCCLGACQCSPAVTVSLSGFADKYESEPLCILRFSSSCGGSGASGYVTAPGGEPDEDSGPIEGVKLTKNGSGYAKFGRVAPVLSLANQANKAANVTFSLANTADACGCGLWSIASISVNNGGSGYQDYEPLAVQISSGDTEVQSAQGYIRALRMDPAPVIAATTSGGIGASFSVTTSPASTATDYETWSISGVTVTGTTSGYADGQPLTFSGANVLEVTKADVRIATVRVEPTVTAAIETASGVDAQISITLESNNDDPETWSISGHKIENAGSGYQLADSVVIAVDDGTEQSPAIAEIASIGEAGEILSVVFSDGGQFYKATDEIASVNVIDGGEYFDDSRPLSEVIINNDDAAGGTGLPLGGLYYREDKSEPPCVVSEITVTVEQFGPSMGSGAEFKAKVDDDPTSPTFGWISSVAITDPGDGYLAYMLLDTCMSRFDGRTFTLPIATPDAPNDQVCIYGGACGDVCSDSEVLTFAKAVAPPGSLSPVLSVETKLHGTAKGYTQLKLVESQEGCESITLKHPSNNQQAVITLSDDTEAEGLQCTLLQNEIAATISAVLDWRGSRTSPIALGSPGCSGGFRRNWSQESPNSVCNNDGPYIGIEYFFTGGGNDVPGGYIPCVIYTNRDGSEADSEAYDFQWDLAITGSLSRDASTCNGWIFEVMVSLQRLPLLLISEQFDFRLIGEIPVDEEGYPSGVAYLRCDREVPETFLDTETLGPPELATWPTNFPRSATVTFTRDLP